MSGNFVVVGFYTRGSHYEESAREMIASAHQFGIETDVTAVDSLGGWQANCQSKARVLAQMVNKYRGRCIAYLDADLTVVRYPSLFDRLVSSDVDFACHYRFEKQLLSGTLFFRCNEAVAELTRAWVDRCDLYREEWDQTSLQRVIEDTRPPIKLYRLPEEYLRIETLPEARAIDPVILHAGNVHCIQAPQGAIPAGTCIVPLVTIDHDDLAAPIRCAGNTAGLLHGPTFASRGREYRVCRFDAQMPNQTGDGAMRLVIEGVAEHETAALSALPPPVIVEQEAVFLDSPDTLRAGPFRYEAQDLRITENSISMEFPNLEGVV